MEFSKSGAPFRAWVLGVEQAAGAWRPDMGRNVTGSFGISSNYGVMNPNLLVNTGAFTLGPLRKGSPVASTGASYDVAIDASSVWGTEHTGIKFVPPHIWQPIILYLGRPR